MKKFYITFGVNTILGGYYITIQAKSENIARAWMARKSGLRNVWSSIYTEKPSTCKPLPTASDMHDTEIQLYYDHEDHVEPTMPPSENTRWKCLFCNFFGNRNDLKEHSANCSGHPLMARALIAEDKLAIASRMIGQIREDL